MAKSPQKNVPDVGIELRAACMPSEHAFDRATVPLLKFLKVDSYESCLSACIAVPVFLCVRLQDFVMYLLCHL